MNTTLSDELEDFYKDYEEDKNRKNFKLLIDEWEDLDFQLPDIETFSIKPVLNTDEGLVEIDIRKELKSTGKHNLF